MAKTRTSRPLKITYELLDPADPTDQLARVRQLVRLLNSESTVAGIVVPSDEIGECRADINT